MPLLFFEKAFARVSQVTVRLEQESLSPQEQEMPLEVTENPLFRMWRDRQDMTAMAANRMRQFVLDAPKMDAVNIRAMLDEGRD
jgi:hypothetical protein